jgi:hypothetical protein
MRRLFTDELVFPGVRFLSRVMRAREPGVPINAHPLPESSSMRARRLLLLAALAVAPLAAACVPSLTSPETTPPPANTDTTKRFEQNPWG